MADVGSEDLVECLERAADSAADVEAETRWQQKLIDRLLSDFHTDDPDQPGLLIRCDYFSSSLPAAEKAKRAPGDWVGIWQSYQDLLLGVYNFLQHKVYSVCLGSGAPQGQALVW